MGGGVKRRPTFLERWRSWRTLESRILNSGPLPPPSTLNYVKTVTFVGAEVEGGVIVRQGRGSKTQNFKFWRVDRRTVGTT